MNPELAEVIRTVGTSRSFARLSDAFRICACFQMNHAWHNAASATTPVSTIMSQSVKASRPLLLAVRRTCWGAGAKFDYAVVGRMSSP